MKIEGFTITDAGEQGFYSGRTRYRVACDRCGDVAHQATTHPAYMAAEHVGRCTAAVRPPRVDGPLPEDADAELVMLRGQLAAAALEIGTAKEAAFAAEQAKTVVEVDCTERLRKSNDALRAAAEELDKRAVSIAALQSKLDNLRLCDECQDIRASDEGGF